MCLSVGAILVSYLLLVCEFCLVSLPFLRRFVVPSFVPGVPSVFVYAAINIFFASELLEMRVPVLVGPLDALWGGFFILLSAALFHHYRHAEEEAAPKGRAVIRRHSTSPG